MAAFSPSTPHSWLGIFEFPHVWNLKKLLKGWRFTPLYCVKGKVKKWLGGSRHLLVPSGLEKSHCTP
jgi:hypothetical protein